MHELGLAVEIAAIAGEEARKAGARRVEAVHLRLGAQAGVVKEALLFAWEAASAESAAAGARLAIEDAEGREFEVVALEVEDE